MMDLSEAQELIDDIQDRDNLLNDWEMTFTESLEIQISEKDYISEKQASILERIWEKVTRRG